MRFGLRKLTLLDYPGAVACTVFTGGCNFRCPFCHNASLVTSGDGGLEYDRDGLMSFLEKRRKVLDGVCVTGGEPLLHRGTLGLLADIKALGYRVKLDTNGSFPGALQEAVAEGLVDSVAMDIKNSPGKYEISCGSASALDAVCDSVKYLLGSGIDYEFRTTVAGSLHSVEDFTAIGQWLKGCKRYFIQKFVNSGDVLAYDPAMEIGDAALRTFLTEVQKFIPHAAIRGE